MSNNPDVSDIEKVSVEAPRDDMALEEKKLFYEHDRKKRDQLQGIVGYVFGTADYVGKYVAATVICICLLYIFLLLFLYPYLYPQQQDLTNISIDIVKSLFSLITLALGHLFGKGANN